MSTAQHLEALKDWQKSALNEAADRIERGSPAKDGMLVRLALKPAAPSPESVESELAGKGDGLSSAEAQERLAKYDYNELPEKKTNVLLKFLSYFWWPIPWMIEAAAILSAVVHHWEDFGIILHECRSGLLGRVPGGQSDRRAQSEIGLARPREA
jgi:magnesium-transporting ATPase (P-type)